MVGQDEVLQEQGFFLRDAQFLADLAHLLSAHDQMAQQLPLYRVVRGQSQLGEHELLLLGHVVEQGSGQQQAPVDDVGIKPGQEIRRLEHIARVHQKA